MSFIGDYVVLRASVKGTDGHDSRLQRAHFAADDRLKRDHDFRSNDDGIFRLLWGCAVASSAADNDVHGIRAGEKSTFAPSDFPRGNRVGVVQGENVVRLRKFCEEAGAKHGASAADDFFRGLAD